MVMKEGARSGKILCQGLLGFGLAVWATFAAKCDVGHTQEHQPQRLKAVSGHGAGLMVPAARVEDECRRKYL